MKSRTVLLMAGAFALSMAVVSLANAGALQADQLQGDNKSPTSAPEKPQDNRTEAEKRAARRAANEKREKAQNHGASKPPPREEEEEESRKR